ncbi:hypothetical protein PLEOSDRAFT_161360 [Pleurotus ostreatus PC15]|uniref:Uncharacterized protein n=1 Tax=Pleurotus ostreatus (strain PC15) TaxID=1137138 RepID=A0A067NKI2_PLEO1|nr:hypothetical protein PLEOSDRAFT_161360 [Pleurotus ostreatus PC15]
MAWTGMVVTHMASSDVASNIDTTTLKAYNDEYFSMTACVRDETLLEVHVSTTTEDIIRLSLILPRSGAHTLDIVGLPSLKEADWLSFFRRHIQVQRWMIDEVTAAFVQDQIVTPHPV